MRVTLKDVAQAANVSSATVSKVLNNRYDVAPETAALVEEAIRRVGYKREATWGGRPTSSTHPPSVARTQRLKAATGIALLTPTSIGAAPSPLTTQLVYGAEEVAREQGLNFHLTRFSEDGSLPPCLDPVQVDGLIVRSLQKDITTPLPAIPTVWIFKLSYITPYPGDVVMPDNEMIGQMAAQYLLDRRHQNVAVVTALLNHHEAQVRADQFVRFANLAGASALSVESSDMNAVAEQLLSQSPRVTGLFMPLGDGRLEDLYRVLQRRGVRCGGDGADIEVISCNNDVTHLRLLDPPPANIDIRADEIGRVAAETLLWRIQNPHEHRRCVLVEPRLVEPAIMTEIS